MNELKSSIKFQLKKVLCMGVAIGNVGMEEKEIYVNTQARHSLGRCVDVSHSTSRFCENECCVISTTSPALLSTTEDAPTLQVKAAD